MKWRKDGRVYVPDGRQIWAQSHAMIPTPLLRGDTIRVFIACCDAGMIGRIGYVDVDARDPSRILKISHKPVLDAGDPGCFDDNGVNPLTILEVGDELWMYYVGYQLSDKVRYFLFSGLAISKDGGETFIRKSRVPILDRSDKEPFIRSAISVLQTENGFRAWYVVADRYEIIGDRLRPVYDVRHAKSSDGMKWPTEGELALPLNDPSLHGYGRPYVLPCGNGFEMFYSVRWRNIGYRLGYATSPDGLTWIRADSELGIDVSAEGWDSEMICYAAVLPTPHGTYMFYNGNDYGRTGFGIARLLSR